MAYTMDDFKRDYIKKNFAKLTRQEQEELLRALPAEARLVGLPAEARLAGLSADEIEHIRKHLDELAEGPPKAKPRKPRRKR